MSPYMVTYRKKLGKIGGKILVFHILCYLSRKKDCFNTEISYSLKNKTIDIVEHRAEKI